RFSRDWSSDVCSSDLGADPQAVVRAENIAQYTAIMFSAAGFGSVFVGRLVDRTRLQFLAFLLTGLAGSCLLLVGFVTSATSLVADRKSTRLNSSHVKI